MKLAMKNIGLGVLFCLLPFTLFVSCGTDDSDSDTSTASTYTFDTDIAPIIAASCASSSCHGEGASNTVYVANKENLVENKTNVKSRLNGTGAIMPPTSSDYSLSSANKAKLVSYLSQTTMN